MENEQIPLVMIGRYIQKHKIVSLSMILVIILAIGSYFVIDKIAKKKKAETEFAQMTDHILRIIGVYTGGSINLRLTLRADNTATFECDGVSSKAGYWKEYGDGGPIKINFSDPFKIDYDIYVSTLYLYDGFLWQSMDAMRSQDYSKCWIVERNR